MQPIESSLISKCVYMPTVFLVLVTAHPPWGALPCSSSPLASPCLDAVRTKKSRFSSKPLVFHEAQSILDFILHYGPTRAAFLSHNSSEQHRFTSKYPLITSSTHARVHTRTHMQQKYTQQCSLWASKTWGLFYWQDLIYLWNTTVQGCLFFCQG